MLNSRLVSTVQEIKSAIARLNDRDRAVLTAELFALVNEPNADELDQSLQRGLADVEAGRVRPIEEVKNMISRWRPQSPDCAI